MILEIFWLYLREAAGDTPRRIHSKLGSGMPRIPGSGRTKTEPLINILIQ